MTMFKNFKSFMDAQIDEMEKQKWLEGERIRRDPGDNYLKQWITNGSAAEFRKWWEENINKL